MPTAADSAGKDPVRRLRNVAASPPARLGLDVPIETKFYPPTARKEWVERQDLVQQLTAATAKLILVDAPAGFGKTTLVAQWSASPLESRPFAWLSLDDADNDPGRLWWHVVCALQRACPDLEMADVLQALRVPIPDIEGTMLPLLLNELAALSSPVVLALDDYDLVNDPLCHHEVEFLLLHLPPAAQVVLITRADPALPLARLRAAGELAEIRSGQLRLAPDEAAGLVRAVADVELTEPDLLTLVDRTEGWPAGLYLAALSLHGHPSPTDFIAQFTGDSRYIVDFLAEEVLSRQPAEIRRFLMQTSVLGSFCAPLCESVTGVASAADIIGILDRENLFVLPLDDKRQWFRYHHLFAQVLRSELGRTEPDLVPVLHQRASGWHRLSGSADQAIGHAFAAGDVPGSIDLIARYWYAYCDSGQTSTVRGWLRSLGDDAIATHPVAAHCAAWAAALSGDRESVQRWLPVIDAATDQGPLPDGMQSLRSSAALLRGTFGFDGVGPMRDAAALAVTLENDPASPWFAAAEISLAAASYWSGDLELAADYAMRALLSTSIAMVRMHAFAVVAYVTSEQGSVARAEEFARAAHAIATDGSIGLRGTPQSAIAHTALGMIHATSGQLQDARSEFEHALKIRRAWLGISPWPTLEIQLRLAPVLLELGDRQAAAALLDEARKLLAAFPDGAQAQHARLDGLTAVSPRLAAAGEALTQREAAVLRLLRGTLSLREIGQQLYVSQNTVKTHTRAIYRKLGVSTRQQAVAALKEKGLQ